MKNKVRLEVTDLGRTNEEVRVVFQVLRRETAARVSITTRKVRIDLIPKLTTGLMLLHGDMWYLCAIYRT